MIVLELRYRLTEEEAQETQLCLDWKREGKFKTINLYLISGIGVAVLICYMKNPEQFFLVLLLLCIIALLFYITYGRAASRRRRARKLTKGNGEYLLELKENTVIYGEEKGSVKLTQGKNQFIFSANLCVIKTEKELFSIPMRLLSEEQKEELRGIAKMGQNKLVHVLIGTEESYESGRKRKDS